MLTLSKKIDYALISLAWLVEREGRYVSAREIAQANDLPLPVLMQILKALHNHGVLRSTRGVRGGYQIDADLDALSLYDLSEMVHAGESDRPENEQEVALAPGIGQLSLHAVRLKLSQFLRDVPVSEVVRPGKRIDVPLDRVRIVERFVVEKVSV